MEIDCDSNTYLGAADLAAALAALRAHTRQRGVGDGNNKNEDMSVDRMLLADKNGDGDEALIDAMIGALDRR
jgi:hypothetical protein